MTTNGTADDNGAEGEGSSPSGPNSWLVDEMYRQYQGNPRSVPEEWQKVFENGPPSTAGETTADVAAGTAAPSNPAPAPAPPAAPVGTAETVAKRSPLGPLPSTKAPEAPAEPAPVQAPAAPAAAPAGNGGGNGSTNGGKRRRQGVGNRRAVRGSDPRCCSPHRGQHGSKP